MVGDSPTHEGTHATFEIDEAAAIAHCFAESGSDETIKSLFSKQKDLTSIRTALVERLAEAQQTPGNPAVASQLQTLQQQIFTRIGESKPLGEAVAALLCDRIPKFFYFSQYSLLPGRIDLLNIDGASDGPSTSAFQTARALLQLANTTTASLRQENYEERKAELEATSNDLTDQVFTYWSQNDDP